MVTILQKEEPVLRAVAKPVGKEMFGTPALGKILKDMKSAIASQDDAVAIAAPQIGVSLRIFVVSGRVFDMLMGKPEEEQTETEDVVFINPEIVKLSKERKQVEEGCLSVRYLYGKISRAKRAKVKAYDPRGKAFEVSGSGLLAQIFQHECDHLDGKLFIDEAVELEDLPPEEAPAKSKKLV